MCQRDEKYCWPGDVEARRLDEEEEVKNVEMVEVHLVMAMIAEVRRLWGKGMRRDVV